MPVGDDVAVRKPLDEAVVTTCRGAGVVHEADSHALGLDDRSFLQDGTQVGLVHVPVDRLDRYERPELLEHRARGHVPDVQRDRGLLEDPYAPARQLPPTPREVRIAEQGDQIRPSTNRPSR